MATALRPAPPTRSYADREVTQPPNWHELVVWDMLLNAVTTGLFLVTAVCVLARPDAFAPVAVWAFPLALAVLLADLSCLVFDLGHPTRFHHMLRVFKPSSPMSLGTWFLTGYSLPLTLLAALGVFGLLGGLPTDSTLLGWVRPALIIVGLPLAFGSAGYKGVLFSTSAQPGWRDARWLGAYHLASALALGTGVLLLLSHATGAAEAAGLLRPAFAGLAVVGLATYTLLGVELAPALRRVRSRGTALAGVIAVGTLGGLAPPLLLAGNGPSLDAVAVACALAGGYSVRAVVVRLPHAVRHA